MSDPPIFDESELLIYWVGENLGKTSLGGVVLSSLWDMLILTCLEDSKVYALT